MSISNKLNRRMIEAIRDIVLQEAGYARAMEMMLGLVPTVKSFGIITAENPMGKKLPVQENNERNLQLAKNLRSAHLGFIQIKGKYGYLENPYFIPNIAKDEIIDFGLRYSQEAVIWGATEAKGLGTFYYIETRNKDITRLKFSDYRITSVRKVFYRKDKAIDYYTEIKGRKFIIPFFDEKMKNAEFKDGYIVDVETGNKIVYKSERDETEFLGDIEKEVIMRVEHILDENRTGKSRWENRGIIKAILGYDYFAKKSPK